MESPELATRISSFLIAEDGRFVAQPGYPVRALKYRLAFEEVTRTVKSDLFQHGQAVFPNSRSRRSEDEGIIRELGFVPWPLADWQMHVLENSGAYTSPTKYSKDLLLASAKVPKQDLSGVELFNTCLRQLVLEICNVFILDYTHSRPRSVYRNGDIFLATRRACSRCGGGSRLRWIGPTSVRAMEHFKDNRQVALEQMFEVYENERGIYGVRGARCTVQ